MRSIRDAKPPLLRNASNPPKQWKLERLRVTTKDEQERTAPLDAGEKAAAGGALVAASRRRRGHRRWKRERGWVGPGGGVVEHLSSAAPARRRCDFDFEISGRRSRGFGGAFRKCRKMLFAARGAGKRKKRVVGPGSNVSFGWLGPNG